MLECYAPASLIIDEWGIDRDSLEPAPPLSSVSGKPLNIVGVWKNAEFALSGIMPAQLPAGGPGAEAPREQPASPTTDDAPPPVKQEYTGAQGAEIAGSADSASAGPGASDSLAAQRVLRRRDLSSLLC